MTPKQIEALKALVLTIVALAAVLGLIASDVAAAIPAVVTAGFVALAAFVVKTDK